MMLSKLVEIASVFVCFYHISNRIVNANHLIVRADERLTGLQLQSAIGVGPTFDPFRARAKLRCHSRSFLRSENF
jgi:hypothetical protein